MFYEYESNTTQIIAQYRKIIIICKINNSKINNEEYIFIMITINTEKS